MKKNRRKLLNIVKYDGDNINSLRMKNVDVVNPIEYKDLVLNMIYTMNRVGAAGLAAPQVGENINLFVANMYGKPLVIFNPKIIDAGDGIISIKEGCLSIPNKYVKINRPGTVILEFVDVKNKKHVRTFSGYSSIVICHELDHLDGKLIIDYDTNNKDEKEEI
jgi:peptide deformylase